MLRLDRYRGAAKRAAWYDNDPNDPPNWNPFRKINSRPRRLADEEGDPATRIPTHCSETDALNILAEQRRSKNYEENPPPKHAQTLPPKPVPSSSSNVPFSDAKDMAYEPESIDHEKENSQDSGTSSGGKTSETVIGSDDPVQNGAGKPRRRGRKFPFIGKKSRIDDRTEDEKPIERKSSLFKKDNQKFTAMGQLRATLLNSWINILLIFVPIGIAVNYASGVPRVGVFVINFIAIIPLAAMLSYATEEIAIRTGETIGGLLNATFG